MVAQGAGRTTRNWRRLRASMHADALARVRMGEPVVCWLCQMPIDMTITDPHDPDVWEPDHKISRSERPDLAEDPANLADSHRQCNNTKADGKAMAGLGVLSRQWISIR